MANGTNPYGLLNSPFVRDNTRRINPDYVSPETYKQKRKVKKMWEDQQVRLKQEYKEKSDLGFLGDALDIAGLFFGPAGVAATQGIKSYAEMRKKEDAGKDFLRRQRGDKFGKTFLKGTDKFQQDLDYAKSLQVSDSDILKSVAKDTLSGFISGSSADSGKLGESIIAGIKNPGEGKFLDQLKDSFNPEKYMARNKDVKSQLKNLDFMKSMPNLEGLLKDLQGFDKNMDLEQILKSLFEQQTGKSGSNTMNLSNIFNPLK